VGPSHPHVHAGRIIRADEISVLPPGASRRQKIVRQDVDFDRDLPPRFMPDPEETAVPVERERRVALEEKFGERSCFTGMELLAAWMRAIAQQAAIGRYGSTQAALAICVIIRDAAEAVGQAEGARPQPDAEPIGKPFGEKENAGLAVVAHISPNVEKLVRSNRLEEPFAEPATETRSHAPEREGNEADKRASI
jgi:hypothetical protein